MHSNKEGSVLDYKLRSCASATASIRVNVGWRRADERETLSNRAARFALEGQVGSDDVGIGSAQRDWHRH